MQKYVNFGTFLQLDITRYYRFAKGLGVTKYVKILNLMETGACFRQKLIFTDNPSHTLCLEQSK